MIAEPKTISCQVFKMLSSNDFVSKCFFFWILRFPKFFIAKVFSEFAGAQLYISIVFLKNILIKLDLSIKGWSTYFLKTPNHSKKTSTLSDEGHQEVNIATILKRSEPSEFRDIQTGRLKWQSHASVGTERGGKNDDCHI